MAKVITFSRQFPSYHPRKGELTYFVEKFRKSRHLSGERPYDITCHFSEEIYFICECKHHTIRAGHRFKAGDYFSPRVWSGKPYNSKQIIIGPDTEVKKTWDFTIDPLEIGDIYVNGHLADVIKMEQIIKNDGLNIEDFYEWFKYPKPFDGQIICYNENINY